MAKEQTDREEILELFPNPLYTGSHILFREDLEQQGLTGVVEQLPRKTQKLVLNSARTLTLIKPELAFHFLSKSQEILRFIDPGSLDEYTRVVLDMFDTGGINPARDLILGLDEHPEFKRHWGGGVPFHEVAGILLNFLHALGPEELTLEPGSEHYTDTLTIYLPEKVDLFHDQDRNFLLYKTMVTHKFGQVHLGTFRLQREQLAPLFQELEKRYGLKEDGTFNAQLSRFLHLFPDLELVTDLFNLFETLRIEAWIAEALPGLSQNLSGLKQEMASTREVTKTFSPKNRVMALLIDIWLRVEPASFDHGLRNTVSRINDLMEKPAERDSDIYDVAHLTAEAYGIISRLPGQYQPSGPVFYMGRLRPEEAEQGRRRKRESTRLKFREELAKLVRELPDCEDVRIDLPGSKRRLVAGGRPEQPDVPDHLLVDGKVIPVSEAMRNTIEEIYEDLGMIPRSYLAIADEMSGHFFRSLCQVPEGTAYFLSESAEGTHAIDEWDYRRQGYRKRWALLRETGASEGSISFANETLSRYRGMIGRIKRQFEQLRLQQILLRRQPEGDHIDLDAAVEAFADRNAGLQPSERLFMRLRRDKRDIATAFLVDLSGSTSGWINDMERAALLILCEAVEILQDRFAVYGFSGYTRKRCELFRIKGFDEAYEDRIKRRVANLRALEYTRMGPPIRHLTKLLLGVEARTRLLITLSDGKPDDYDGYGGDYGIEDTRQALLEAKRLGMHPFCITIDKAEHSYLAHMYGAVNYVFVDDLSKLPEKVPEIYRKLTT